MLTFLIALSFIIHISIIVVMFTMYRKIIEKQSEVENVSLLLDEYLTEMKMENERLQSYLSRVNERQVSNIEDEIEIAESLHNSKKENEAAQSKMKYDPLDNVKKRETTIKSNEEYEVSLQAKILQLFNEGQTVEQIARQLNCGKTEVELYIQMYDK